jgi:hypothetical protein
MEELREGEVQGLAQGVVGDLEQVVGAKKGQPSTRAHDHRSLQQGAARHPTSAQMFDEQFAQIAAQHGHQLVSLFRGHVLLELCPALEPYVVIDLNDGVGFLTQNGRELRAQEHDE